ncbi:GTP cyclohydrolase I [Streptomyces kutzneri]|uniref:GTP cyclohydrolase I n=1 Tax=Streptomyces kutzneri TaxID=3051179 RepID=UPI0028D7C465|nr:GTP cyclohydrolase I [Streptomyces sp. DSM 40907]
MASTLEPLRSTDAPNGSEIYPDSLETIARQLLMAIGEDPDREGLVDTPRRYAQWWREFIDYEAGKVETLFDSVSEDQLVFVSDMRVWSLCEHHLLPFNCTLNIAYRSAKNLLGLSKFGRIAHKHAHKLQVQERLVADIAKEIEDITGSPDVAVIGRGEHLCMTMRGIRTGALMTSAVFGGVFQKDGPERSHLQTLAHASGNAPRW